MVLSFLDIGAALPSSSTVASVNVLSLPFRVKCVLSTCCCRRNWRVVTGWVNNRSASVNTLYIQWLNKQIDCYHLQCWRALIKFSLLSVEILLNITTAFIKYSVTCMSNNYDTKTASFFKFKECRFGNSKLQKYHLKVRSGEVHYDTT